MADKMKENNTILIFAQILIGTGFSFLYMQHVRVIFESRTNIAHLTQLERESLFRREDALHYSFYKTLTEAPDFWVGYSQLQNMTNIEHPRKVNVLQRFYILPELVAGYLYHMMRRLNFNGYIPFSCWQSRDLILSNGISKQCDNKSQPLQLYLEFVWLMGGITLMGVYMYGTLLSENVFGGIYGVISYVMFHSFAAKIYERPAARENFAFPLMFLQMFYICLCIRRIHVLQKYQARIFTFLKLTLLTTFTLLCWHFSLVLFTTQLIIMIIFYSINSLHNEISNAFTTDYSLSQLLGVGVAYWISHYNNQFLYTWHLSLAFSLLFISSRCQLKWKYSAPAERRFSTLSLKATSITLIIAGSFHSKLIDFLTRLGITRPQDNSYTLFSDLNALWVMQKRTNFITKLAACNPLYAPFEWSELWPLTKTLILKPYCMYGVVMLAMFFRKWRKSNTNQLPNHDHIERAKKYVLEDFLEENRISMRDISKKQTEELLIERYELLESCAFNYECYKVEKAKFTQNKNEERFEFMDDIKRLRAQINKNTDKQRMVQQQQEGSQSTAPTNTKSPELNSEQQKADTDSETNKPNIDEQIQSQSKSGKKPSKKETEINIKRQIHTKCRIKDNNCDMQNLDTSLLSLPYLYSFMQMVTFTIMGLMVKKLFFMSFTQGCIIAPTVCSKVWYHRHRNIFWSVTIFVFILSMFDPGLINIQEEYYPTRRPERSDDFETMLEWIQMNTEHNAVFAGPIDIIGTVHLTTKRPIVNHAHLEMRQISERTEYVYSVYSRQQSSDIYNQYSQLKIEYLIISIADCTELMIHDCDMLSVWDDVQTAYRKYPQFCSELMNKNFPSFLKVYANAEHIIVKLFSQAVQINLKHDKMREMIM